MKIKLIKRNGYWCYGVDELNYKQEQFDYVFKYLNFDKLDKNWWISFKNKETEKWFSETYINSLFLSKIHNQLPEGYEWLKDNWGKGEFKTVVRYTNKQELKIIVNKVINIELKRIK